MNAKSVIGQSLESYELQTKQFRKAFAGVPNNRVYALDDISLRGGVALTRSLQDLSGRANIGIVHTEALLTRIVKVAPDSWPPDYGRALGIVQAWKVYGQTRLLPFPSDERWKNPIDGSRLGNPFAPDSIDRNGQAVLLRKQPDLAELYQDLVARSPFEIIAEREDETKRRAQLAALTYTAQDQETNPYRNQTDGAGQALFSHVQGELVASVWLAEARMKVRLPWSSESAYLNRTINGTLFEDFNRTPFFGCDGELFMRAAAIDAALAKAIRDEASDAAAKAQQRVNQLARAHR